MIPAWKLKRELQRLRLQIAALPDRIIGRVLQRRHDSSRWTAIDEHAGQQAQKAKIAVFLIYQPKALAPSVLQTCRYLDSQGYAVLLVANGGLEAVDRALCLPWCWRLLERPNFGYDFGGYRDGIFWLWREKIVPSRLLLVNDSIWFPLCTDSDVLSRIEALDHDPAGLLMHTRSRYAGDAARKLEGSFVESYLLLISSTLFQSDAFARYWRDYVPSNAKHVTIKRGELGFSYAMRAAGFDPGAISDRQAFLDAIVLQEDDFLAKTLRYAAYSDDDLRAEGAALVDRSSAHWRRRTLAHIEQTVLRRRFNSSFAYATEHIFALSFHKKNREMLFRQARRPFLAAADEGDLNFDNTEALAEIRALASQERQGDAMVHSRPQDRFENRVKDALFQGIRRVRPVITFNGISVPLKDAPIGWKTYKQFRRRTYEAPEIAAIRGLLRDGDKVLELGTGLGVVSAVTSRMRSGVTIRSYEGNTALLPAIKRLHEMNGIREVEVINEILLPSPSRDSVSFNLHERFAKSSILSDVGTARQITVPCRDVNAALDAFRPDMLICDIEGGEEKLFDGIRLDGIRAVVIELHPSVISRQAVARVFDTCAAARLYPIVELSSATVVAFERVENTTP